ncbi:hypothetical protein GWI33_000217 [Rhynchophorus ferrugineus]|uniref:Uncharacterized protein n=1 Tax=Rhynchophorus ferrugineus TaxID=354439 RepID=A0A834IWQ6_RHYFE|nr:hypothetical protein GWI33_000217 [Rhynchophorus ferrugineus]
MASKKQHTDPHRSPLPIIPINRDPEHANKLEPVSIDFYFRPDGVYNGAADRQTLPRRPTMEPKRLTDVGGPPPVPIGPVWKGSRDPCSRYSGDFGLMGTVKWRTALGEAVDNCFGYFPSR